MRLTSALTQLKHLSTVVRSGQRNSEVYHVTCFDYLLNVAINSWSWWDRANAEQQSSGVHIRQAFRVKEDMATPSYPPPLSPVIMTLTGVFVLEFCPSVSDYGFDLGGLIQLGMYTFCTEE